MMRWAGFAFLSALVAGGLMACDGKPGSNPPTSPGGSSADTNSSAQTAANSAADSVHTAAQKTGDAANMVGEKTNVYLQSAQQATSESIDHATTRAGEAGK